MFEEEFNKYNEWFVGKGKIEFCDRGVGWLIKWDCWKIECFKDKN